MTTTAIKDLIDSDGGASEFTISYNDIPFGPLVKFKLAGDPEYDPARRTTSSEEYTLRATSIEYSSTESGMAAILSEKRHWFMQPGGRLVINGLGFGDIDTGGATPELSWGPHPIHADYTMLGGGVAWQFDWICKFKINPCGGSLGSVSGSGSKPLMMFNYDVSYSHDDLGFTTRVISGVLRIPQPSLNSYTVFDIAERYRPRYSIPVPSGYRRVHGNEASNGAQDELHFVVVDEQMKTEAPPAGIATCDVRYAINSQNAKSNINYTVNIGGQLETLPGFPKSLAMVKFLQIAYSRLEKIQQTTGGTLIPMRIDMEHRPFTRASTFSMSFLLRGATDPRNLFKPDLLYGNASRSSQPLPDSNYFDWTTAPWNGNTLRKLWENGGQTNLTTKAPSMVDLCNTKRSVNLAYDCRLYPLGAPEPGSPANYFSKQRVDPKQSWLGYEPVVEYRRVERLSVNKRDADLSKQKPQATGKEYRDSLQSSGLTPTAAPYPDVGDTLCRVGAPEQLLIFKGKAWRVEYPIDMPVIRAIQGVPLDLLDQRIESTPGPGLFANRTYFGKWLQVYRPRSYLPATAITAQHPQIELQTA